MRAGGVPPSHVSENLRSHRSTRPGPRRVHRLRGPGRGGECRAKAGAGRPRNKTVWHEADKTALRHGAQPRAATSGSRCSRAAPARSSTPTCPRPACAPSSSSSPTATTFTDRESTDTGHARRAGPTRAACGFTADQHRNAAGSTASPRPFVTDPRPRRRRGSRCGCGRSTATSYQLFALHDPALDNSGADDRGAHRRARPWSPPTATTAPAPLVPDPRSAPTSNGFLGVDDGWTDLADDHALDNRVRRRRPGQRRADRARRPASTARPATATPS